MKPQNTLILVSYEEPKEKTTKSGIIITGSGDQARGFLREGTVLEINRKEETEEKDIKVGDKILFNINAYCYLPNDKTKGLIRKEDVYLVL